MAGASSVDFTICFDRKNKHRVLYKDRDISSRIFNFSDQTILVSDSMGKQAVKEQKRAVKSKKQEPVVETEVPSEEEDIGEVEAGMDDEMSSEESEEESEESEDEKEQDEEEDEKEDEESEEDSEVEKSEGDSASEGDSEEESDYNDDIPKKKKRKVDEDGSQAFTKAFDSIMGSKLKAYKRKAPIMARNKLVQKQLDSDKLELKAKRELLSEKKRLQDKHRVKNLLPTAEDSNVRELIENEKKLKKIAQKGVVRLFNAVLSTQVRSTQDISKEKVGQVKKQELFNEMSKEKFLDLVQSAGKS